MARCRKCKSGFTRPRHNGTHHVLICQCGEYFRFDRGPIQQREMRLEQAAQRDG